MVKLSPSILSADFLAMRDDLKKFEEAGVDMLHVDVMDGQFVPNLSFGVPLISSIKKYTNIPLDVHLMIDRPHRFLKDFLAVSDYLGFHYEAGSDVEETLKEIRANGVKSCLTIKPATKPEEILKYLPLCDMVLIMSVEPGFGGQKFMPEALEKLEYLAKKRNELGLDFLLEVDGGINAETAPLAVKSGADVLVAGSFIFSAEDMTARVKEIKSIK